MFGSVLAEGPRQSHCDTYCGTYCDTYCDTCCETYCGMTHWRSQARDGRARRMSRRSRCVLLVRSAGKNETPEMLSHAYRYGISLLSA